MPLPWLETGIIATGDVDALIALKPDACVFSGLYADYDLLCRLLEAGINVVTPTGFSVGKTLNPENRSRVETAAKAGGATFFSTGVYPGFANFMALYSTQVCERVDQIRITESVDTTAYNSWELETQIGFGQLPGAPGLVETARTITLFFGDMVENMADALGANLDSVTFDVNYALATADNVLDYTTIRKGQITAIEAIWRGKQGERVLIDSRFQWVKGENVEEGFEVRHGYFIEIDGLPSVRTHIELVPPPEDNGAEFVSLGMVGTAMNPVNAIPSVIAARPGIANLTDLQVFVSTGAT